jgi:hypothetical protein
MPAVAIGTELRGPGQKDYTITDFLGRGAFGEVYRAIGTTLATSSLSKYFRR